MNIRSIGGTKAPRKFIKIQFIFHFYFHFLVSLVGRREAATRVPNTLSLPHSITQDYILGTYCSILEGTKNTKIICIFNVLSGSHGPSFVFYRLLLGMN